jgi:Ca2+-transporting ATPase
MMGHVWEHDGEVFVAAKGSPERIMALCVMAESEREEAQARALEMSRQGLRVIAVADMHLADRSQIPDGILDTKLKLAGLVGLADPPRESVKEDILRCQRAGVRVVMITGDNGVTASSIARQVGFEHSDYIITGEELDSMTDEQLKQHIREVSIFARVVPEHKMRIVKAFRENGEIVAMTGDGVNDAPALKHADIGIAMGLRGSEVAREAADMILMDDNFSTIVTTIRDGRRIFDNIRKAVGYVLTIHIPIALSSLIAPMLGIAPAGLFLLPLHVVLLELIIDPTCSIVLERQPAEPDIMRRPPRDPGEKLLTTGTLVKSVLQGLAVFAASFGVYFTVLGNTPENAPLARAMGLAVLMLANLFLVQVNSAHSASIFKSIKLLIKDKVMWAVNLGTLAGLMLILYTPLSGILKLAPMSFVQLLICLGIAAASVLWYEIVKWVIRRKERRGH